MAQALYKWTGDITEPDGYDSEWEAPQWYGYDDSGNGYAFLEADYAALCSSSNDDLAATTATADKSWVKANSPQAKNLNRECVEEIRQSYSIDDELEALRTDDSTVKDAIAAIVASCTTKKNALVGD